MICHIDMDAFFASVEQRDRPELRGKPIAVAGTGNRAVVSTASYEARKFGVHSAMPVFTAKKRCPQLILIPVNKARYHAVSCRIMEILGRLSPLVEPVSIDEAYLDISGSQRLLGSPLQIAKRIKKDIFQEVGLTCSIGIAPVKFLAKIASDMKKPDGLTMISGDNVENVISFLPIEKVPGVGHQAMEQMKKIQIQTLGDVRGFSAEFLEKQFGKWGIRLHQLARGIDMESVEPLQIRKSISSETTMDEDIVDEADVRKQLLVHSQQVGRDLRACHQTCAHVSIKIKFADFSQISRGYKLSCPVCSSEAIFEKVVKLYKNLNNTKKIRLIGVGVSRLEDGEKFIQKDLFQTDEQKEHQQWESVDTAIDAIGKKFGSSQVVLRACLTKTEGS